MFNTDLLKKSFSELEEEVLAYWRKTEMFKKSLEIRENSPAFTFYDGPPFATGLPHYGHILAGTTKDVIPRYQTMKGHYISRRFGWDCHGLPVEYEMEKELDLSGRQDIEKYGVKNFCESCRGIVLRYTQEWEKTVERMGRWVDFKNDYKTMDPNYMESILWVFNTLWEKDLIYEGHKSMHICPRCATTLSNFEVTLGYKDIDDVSVTSMFELADEPGNYILAWTTTPWTLPSNILLAVGADIDYVKIKTSKGNVILAKDLINKFEKILGEEPEIIEKIKGSDLVGKKYIPLFECAKDKEGKKYEVVSADFVSTEDGTGVVHIAPAFGDDDLQLGQKEGAPFFQPLGIDGIFTNEAPEFLQGKEASNSNKDVINHLKEKGLVFEAQSYRHSYPHCWRCDSKLLNYSTSSFFVAVNEFKNNVLKTNQKIHWVPEHIKDGRFGKWLENAKDWSISRNRFWGAPIPVWKCDACEEKEVIGSVRELSDRGVKKNKIMVMRHGEGEHNIKNIVSSAIDSNVGLTEKGKEQARQAGESIKNTEIDLIIASPLQRTRETTEEFLKGFSKDVKVVFDDRVREIDAGDMENKSIDDWLGQFKNNHERFYTNPHNGESKQDVEKRVKDLIKELYQKYRNKNILIIGHGVTVRMVNKYFLNLGPEEIFDLPTETGVINTFSFDSVPTNDNGEIDLHRPYIDEVEIQCKCGGVMRRVPDVLDCWFESGSMPYAERHYPFENKEKFEHEFPADFISESLDQTRGWFYTLHILANGLFGTESFKNCVVSGIVLAEDGHKMSKSKKNYPEPELIFNKYGADAMRFYLMSSTLMKADDLRFSEKGVEEVLRKVFLPIKNSYAFFASLANITKWELTGKKPDNKLDKWILAELREFLKNFTEHMDNYYIDNACREIPEFLDKLTNFYIRRSRRRFWDEENSAFETLFTILITVCKALAPISPMFPEAIYQELVKKTPDAPESVHLCDWPDYKQFDDDSALREEINAIRTIISLGLAVRASSKIRVRQPLQKAQIALPPRLSKKIITDNEELIKEELNIKEIEILNNPEEIAQKIAKPDARKLGPRLGKEVQNVIIEAKKGNFSELKDGKIQVGDHILNPDELEIAYLGKEGFEVESAEGIVVALDTELSNELKEEGFVREIIRHLQDMRKEADYNINDRISAEISGADEIIKKYEKWVAKEILADKIDQQLNEVDLEKEVEIEGITIVLRIKK